MEEEVREESGGGKEEGGERVKAEEHKHLVVGVHAEAGEGAVEVAGGALALGELLDHVEVVFLHLEIYLGF